MKLLPPLSVKLRFPESLLLRLLPVALLAMAAAFTFGPDIETGPGLDLLYTLRGQRPAPANVVIVTLDGVSARALNLPERPDRWPRSLHARLVQELTLRGARAIGFDLLFEIPRIPADDQALALALKQAGNVVLAAAVDREPVHADDGKLIAQLDRLVLPMPLLQEAAWASAPFLMPKTADGALEFWTTIPMVGDRPSLPLLMAERMGAHPHDGQSTERRLLNLYGPLATIKTIHYSDALKLAADPPAGAVAFGGKAVLIGYSEANQSRQIDAFHTPFSTREGTDVSGVELCATALANLLDGSALRRPSYGTTLALLLIWTIALALPWIMLRTGPAQAVSLGLWLSYGLTALWAFDHLNLWLPVLLPLALAPALTVPLGLLQHQKTARRRQVQLEQAVDLGLTRNGMEKLAAILPNRSEGATLFAVCLCSDIVSYTRFSERLQPADARDALNRYFSRFIPVVEKHGGYVMDIVGDSIMCVWIADATATPNATEACRRAQAATLELHRIMNQGSEDGALRSRFGLHYGPVFIGPVGAHRHSEFRAVGDIVNTSSRIQAANKILGSQILASAEVVAGATEFPNRRLGRFSLVGKSQPVDLYEIHAEPRPDIVQREFELGRNLFWAGHPRDAEKHFLAARARQPEDGPIQFYLARCASRRNQPETPLKALDLTEK